MEVVTGPRHTVPFTSAPSSCFISPPTPPLERAHGRRQPGSFTRVGRPLTGLGRQRWSRGTRRSKVCKLTTRPRAEPDPGLPGSVLLKPGDGVWAEMRPHVTRAASANPTQGLRFSFIEAGQCGDHDACASLGPAEAAAALVPVLLAPRKKAKTRNQLGPHGSLETVRDSWGS